MRVHSLLLHKDEEGLIVKQVEVVAGAVVSAGRLFATRRGYGPWAGWWEFPGGKLEAGEGRVEALRLNNFRGRLVSHFA